MRHYLFDFNLFVESQQNCLQKLFEDSISQIIFDTANNNSLSSEHILSLGILRGIHKIIDLYHENLHPTEAVAEDLRQLLPSEVEPALMSAFSQAVRFKDSSSAVEALFFTVAQQKIIADDFDVRNSKGSNIGAECPSGKQGIVLAGQDHVCFTTEAFRAVCKSCGYSTRTVCQKLAETKALKDNTSRNQTYLDKLPLPNQQYIYVYKFPADRFSLLQQQENDLKAPSECDITLQLGIGENHLPLIWNGKKNSHICITGSTGSGKTYFLKKLISQLPSQNVRCIVFDIAGDFSTTGKGSPSCWNSLKTEIIDWEKEKIPPMPFYPVFPGETNEMITNRIMGVLSSMLDMGVVQGPLISRTILSGLQNGKISSFFDLIPLIKEQGFSGLVLWKVENLSNRFPKETIPFNWKLDEPGVTVLNLHQGNDDATNSILMEMFLSTIRSIRMSTPQNSYSPIVLVLDECQLLDWSADSSASLIMTQGRKYGVSAWLSTQYIPGKKESDIWEEADMRVYFQPTPREATQIAKQLAKNNKQLVKRYEAILSDLERGQFIYKQNKNIQLSQPPENN